MASMQSSSVKVALVLLLVAMPAQVAAENFNISASDCLIAFVVMNLNLDDYARYPEYFHEQSVVQLAQAGIYTGPLAIEEYLRFANIDNPAFETRTTENQTFALTNVDTSAGVCEFVINNHAHYTFTEIFSNGTLDVVYAFRAFLNITSGKLDRINVFFEDDSLQWMADMIALPKGQEWLCNAMESGCGSTWTFNGLVDQTQCRQQLAALPSTTGETAQFDGDSQACRFLHGVLAEINEDHCPHISFLPQQDKNGMLKCQASYDAVATDLFTPEQLAVFEAFKIENGLPPSGYIPRIPCGGSYQGCPNRFTCAEDQGLCVFGNGTQPQLPASSTTAGLGTSMQGSTSRQVAMSSGTEGRTTTNAVAVSTTLTTTTVTTYETDGALRDAAVDAMTWLLMLAAFIVGAWF